MSGRSQRFAAQQQEIENTAKAKFPTWNANARAYYDDLKDKDRNGKIKPHTLDHHLYHTYLHNMREDKLKQVKADAARNLSTTPSAGNRVFTDIPLKPIPPKPTPAKNLKGDGGKASDNCASQSEFNSKATCSGIRSFRFRFWSCSNRFAAARSNEIKSSSCRRR